MADYNRPTVVQQLIPSSDISPVEALILGKVFSSSNTGDGLYLYSEYGPDDFIQVSTAELEEALNRSVEADSPYCFEIATNAKQLRDEQLELDLSVGSYENILQDIVKRSPTLTYLTIVQSFTCSKMRPDGFGGMAIIITANAIQGKSTLDILEEFLSELEGERVYPLLRLCQSHVRDAITSIIETDPSVRVTPDRVTAADVAQSCLEIAGSTDLSEEQSSATYRAALRAIDLATARRRGQSEKSAPAQSSTAA